MSVTSSSGTRTAHASGSVTSTSELILRTPLRYRRFLNRDKRHHDRHIPSPIHFIRYNFVLVQKALKVTPAKAANVTPKLWEMPDMVKVPAETAGRKVTQIKYANAVAILAIAVFPTHVLGQPIVCTPPPPDPCGGVSGCVILDDEWQVTVEPSGQISLNNKNISRNALEEYAVAWAKEGTWPIVVRGHTGAKYEQITSIVAMFRKAGVRTRVSCVVPPS